MRCYRHPDVDAVATCVACGKAICESCAVDVGGRITCQHCLASGVSPRGRGAQAAPTDPLAIISLVLGIVGLLACLCGGAIGGLVVGAPAAITGWLARTKLLELEQEERKGIEFATVGLALGLAEVITAVVLLILAGASVGALKWLVGQAGR